MYCIIDVETTGGKANNSKITEIAAYRYDGVKIVDELNTLVNPECTIPEYISSLTGITNEMVSNAPKFYEIAKDIVRITEGAVFVAHNVAFDYKMIQSEFEGLGYQFNRDILCTVKLSRSMLPGYDSYSLGNICTDLGIVINGRHRAGGDALATVKLFEIIIKQNNGVVPSSDTEKPLLIQSLNEDIKIDHFHDLPTTTGVYYLKNKEEDVIYIGKSKNIKSRVFNHLKGGRTKKSIKMVTEIIDVDFEETGSELVALLLESEMIKDFQPIYNKSLKRKSFKYGLYSYRDRNGYIRLLIKKGDSIESPIQTFSTYEEATKSLYKLIDEYQLCQKMCGIYKGNNGCFQYQLKQCRGACVGEEISEDYNERVEEMVNRLGLGCKNQIIIDRGRDIDELSVVLIENGNYCGYGYFQKDDSFISTEDFKSVIKEKDHNKDVQRIISSYLKSGKKLVKTIKY